MSAVRSPGRGYRGHLGAPKRVDLSAVSSDRAELSSITTALEELSRRVTGIAERREDDPDDPVSTDLFEVDRSLRNAVRQLERARNKMD